MSIQQVEHVMTREISTEQTAKAGVTALKRPALLLRHGGDEAKACHMGV
jgi:hypothetical protein